MGPTGKISVFILLLVFLLSLFSFLLLPYDPDAIDLSSLKEPPSYRHILGTDNKGRDILARILYGGKISVGISVLAALLSMTIGMAIGLVSGYAGG